MIRFFTFCDHNYAAQVAVMVESLLRHISEPVQCIVYHLDALSYHWGRAASLDTDSRVQFDPIWLVECQEERLSIAEGNRSRKSYCWTLEPAVVQRQLLDSEDGQILFYCDADVMWFADPIPTIRSVMERADVALSPHHFPAGQESRERTVGKFNFGCGVFRACDLTRRIVGEWLDQTLEKCDEFGAGDQKYLDAWPDKLGDRLTELPEGWNVGPWRLPQTAIGTGESSIEGALYVDCINKYSGQKNWLTELISFHAHETRRGTGRNPVTIKGESWNLTNYEIDPETRRHVYEPYIEALSKFL